MQIILEDTNWCKFDDVMSKLIPHYESAGEENLSNFLLYQIVKFSTISCDVKLKSMEEIKSLDEDSFKEFKVKFNPRLLRWIKSLMLMMTKKTNGNSIFTINCFQLIYISTICKAFERNEVEYFYEILKGKQKKKKESTNSPKTTKNNTPRQLFFVVIFSFWHLGDDA